MELLIKQILENKEAAALPSLLESGGLPALVSGLSAVHRANMAAALRLETGLPLVVLCPDDTAAENMARDLSAMLGREAAVLGMRDFTFYAVEAASRQAEQKRIATLYGLCCGTTEVLCVSAAALLQRTIPPETLRQAAFQLGASDSCAIEDVEDALLRCGYSR
ncbi:MAG: transcription-repair coupling factor, partial [Oscillospiraceae bacterium]|nr:transcription-repair coupling factor [Oscillospiraceae bacterium]